MTSGLLFWSASSAIAQNAAPGSPRSASGLEELMTARTRDDTSPCKGEVDRREHSDGRSGGGSRLGAMVVLHPHPARFASRPPPYRGRYDRACRATGPCATALGGSVAGPCTRSFGRNRDRRHGRLFPGLARRYFQTENARGGQPHDIALGP